jgi:hypothetical protein
MAERLTAEPPSLSRAERPNTVFGLLDKRAELVKLQQQLETDLRKVICDIDHLDAAIRLFDPETTNEARARYATQHRAKKGHVIRFVLEWLRKAGERGATTREITDAWIEARGLRSDDATFVMLRKRIGSCLIARREEGLVRNGGLRQKYQVYLLAHDDEVTEA